MSNAVVPPDRRPRRRRLSGTSRAAHRLGAGSNFSASGAYRHLGRTGCAVSRLGLGTLTWGRDTGERDAADQLQGVLGAGGTLVDTADVVRDGGAPSTCSAGWSRTWCRAPTW